MPHSIRELRSLWKPHKERLNGLHVGNGGHPTAIRFHRACSWLQCGEDALARSDYDVALMSQWVAFNALYGQWNAETREPMPDILSWRTFLSKVLNLDRDVFLGRTLLQYKAMVMKVFSDQFLSKNFWQQPSENGDKQTEKVSRRATDWYRDKNWSRIMHQLTERIYFLRCQLVHGAATYNSKLNRDAIRYCTLVLDPLVRSYLRVLIGYGADEDWGSMCYPPLQWDAVQP